MRLSDIDVLSNAVYVDDVPHDQLAYLRAHAPVFRQDVPDPDLPDQVWVISKARDVETVSSQPDIYSSQKNGIILRAPTERGNRIIRGNFINRDDPDHRRLRDLVSRAFTPRAVRTFEHHYRQLSATIVARAVAKGEFDFVAEVSAELPLLAICELLGIPDVDRAVVYRWTNVMLGLEDPEYAAGPATYDEVIDELSAYVLALVEERQDRPSDDILSQLATAPAAERLTDDELVGFTELMMVAGNETTRNNISHGLIALSSHPDQWQALRADPQRWLDPAVEEITRWASPVNYMARTALRDVDLGGQRIRAGDRLAMMYASANRDEDVFADGHRFDIARPVQRHMAFGVGRHFCLGAHLARLETKLVFAELLAQVDQVHVTGPVERLRSSFVHGVKRLPVGVTRGS